MVSNKVRDSGPKSGNLHKTFTFRTKYPKSLAFLDFIKVNETFFGLEKNQRLQTKIHQKWQNWKFLGNFEKPV